MLLCGSQHGVTVEAASARRHAHIAPRGTASAEVCRLVNGRANGFKVTWLARSYAKKLTDA